MEMILVFWGNGKVILRTVFIRTGHLVKKNYFVKSFYKREVEGKFVTVIHVVGPCTT